MAKTFSLEIDPLSSRNGWMDCWLVIDQIIREAVFERRPFVEAFARAFRQFLKTDYIPFLDSGETQFDLRLLPLDRLAS